MKVFEITALAFVTLSPFINKSGTFGSELELYIQAQKALLSADKYTGLLSYSRESLVCFTGS